LFQKEGSASDVTEFLAACCERVDFWVRCLLQKPLAFLQQPFLRAWAECLLSWAHQLPLREPVMESLVPRPGVWQLVVVASLLGRWVQALEYRLGYAYWEEANYQTPVVCFRIMQKKDSYVVPKG